jgi:type II secretory ATPase GspE/PulE/Tfp pilus assembly ATPase PilB-like protein
MLLSKKANLEVGSGASTVQPLGSNVIPVQQVPVQLVQQPVPQAQVVQQAEPVAPPPPPPQKIPPPQKAEKADTTNVFIGDKDETPTAWLNDVFSEAVRLNASDIHIAPEKDYISVRYRLNGVIQEVARWNIDYHEMVISRIKIISGLQVVEKNIPQDGRMELIFESVNPKAGSTAQTVNFRVSTMPTINGEVAVLRALNKEGQILSIEQVGLSEKVLPIVKKMLQTGHGVIMMTGHSGSGKSTTLYAALNEIDVANRAIITLEDPVEYRVEGIRQSQVNLATGFGFELGLKAILRQDPDVIMIGEIRDEETAGIALRLALVGRLVLTTLHTNSITGAVTRMTEMNIAKSVLASAFTGILSERLVRQICPHCKTQAEPPYELMKMFDIEWPQDVPLYAGAGCDECYHTGFKDRIGIFEVLEVTDDFRNLIISGVSLTELEKYVKEHVAQSLREDGFEKVRNGITTLEEVIRATI